MLPPPSCLRDTPTVYAWRALIFVNGLVVDRGGGGRTSEKFQMWHQRGGGGKRIYQKNASRYLTSPAQCVGKTDSSEFYHLMLVNNQHLEVRCLQETWTVTPLSHRGGGRVGSPPSYVGTLTLNTVVMAADSCQNPGIFLNSGQSAFR